MVMDKICKMTVKDVKSKYESFFSISHGVLELLMKNLNGEGGGGDSAPGMDRAKIFLVHIFIQSILYTIYYFFKLLWYGAFK